MARLALIIGVVTLIQVSVMAEALPESDSEARFADDDSSDRSASASASAHAVAQGAQGYRPRPGPYPGPLPTQPPPRPSQFVECLACSGCPQAANATSKFCPISNDNSKNGRCVVYTEKYYHLKTPWVVRGCASERGNCAEIKAAISHQSDLVKLLSCHDCEGDKCNGAGHSAPDLLAALVGVIVIPLFMKCTLS